MSNFHNDDSEELAHSPAKKLKRLLKRNYIDPDSPSNENEPLNNNLQEKNLSNISHLDTNEKTNYNKDENSGEENNNQFIDENAKKIVKKNNKKIKKTNFEAPKPMKPEKKIFSIFEDSNSENDEKSLQEQGQQNEEENSVPQPKKIKTKKKQKNLDIELAIENENSNDLQEEENEQNTKKPKKLKLIRGKKNKEEQDNNEEESQKNEPKKLNRLKKKSNRNMESEENEEEKPIAGENGENEGKNESFIDDEEEKPRKKPKKGKKEKESSEQKQKKIKKPTETTQEILERMRQDPLFQCEEDDENDLEDKPELMSLENNDTYFGVLKKEVQRKKTAALKNHLIIKTRNKFFKEINTLECNPAFEEPAAQNYLEDEEIINENHQPLFLLEIAKKQKNKIDVHSFLDKFNKFREERALNINNNTNTQTNIATNDNENNDTNINKHDSNINKHDSNNIIVENNSNIIIPNPNENLGEPDKENVLPRQGDFLLNNGISLEPDTKNEIKNESNLVESQENKKKKHTLLKATSQELSQFLNNTLSNFSVDEKSNLSLQISIPNLTKMNSNSITDTTLFVNKLSRSNSIFNKSLLALGGFSSNNNTSSQILSHLNNSNLDNREIYKSKLMEEIRKRKSKHLNLKDLQDRFKQTDWSELTNEKQKNQEKNQENNKNNNENEEDDDENDSDYNPEEKNQEEVTKNPQEIDYKRIIQLEEGERAESPDNSEDDSEKESEINENIEKNEENNENKQISEKNNLNETDNPKQEFHPQNSTLDTLPALSQEFPQNNNINTNNMNNNTMPTSMIIEEENEENLLENEQKEVKTLKKLRKLAEVSAVNYVEIQAKMKAEKKARQEALMKDPQHRRMMQSLFEMEAELGSDNEENDDVVKKINKNDDGEHDSDDGMDEDLKEMIDNITTNQEGENELLWNKFYDDVLKQDKENLKKVLERAFNIKKRKSDDFGVGDHDRMNKVLLFINKIIAPLINLFCN